MRKARGFSAGSVVRAVALGAALCAAAVAPGCTPESFNLLQVAGAGMGGVAAAAGTASAGASPSVGGASGSDDLDAGAGRAGSSHGFGGLGGGFHGLGGATATQPSSGGSSEEPCLAGDQCIDGGLNCPPTVQVCKRCTKDWECTDPEAQLCDVQDGRCAECLHDDNCPAGDICHPLTLRCMHSCSVSSDCVFEHDKPQCDMFHACVSCIEPADCQQITGRPNDVCAFGTCVDCYDDKECPPQRPYCVGLVCQTKR